MLPDNFLFLVHKRVHAFASYVPSPRQSRTLKRSPVHINAVSPYEENPRRARMEFQYEDGGADVLLATPWGASSRERQTHLGKVVDARSVDERTSQGCVAGRSSGGARFR